MKIKENISLKKHNTFGINAKAKYSVKVKSIAEVQELISHKRYRSERKFILGGGSNILLLNDFDGLLIRNRIKGIDIIDENETHIWLKVGAGEVWHDLVINTVESNLGGIENLSLIPGRMGAAPMQNIGAYGVELTSVFEELSAVHRETGDLEIFSNKDCAFGYRESVFKNKFKDQFIICDVTIKLNKHPEFNVSYGAIQTTLEEMKIENLSVKAISDAVVKIRSGKLPDPKVLGNSGSFFKNPIVSESILTKIQAAYPDVPNYPAPNEQVKLAAGWLIEKAGWKGKRMGEVGTYEKQALILVNHGKATGEELWEHALKIQSAVEEKFNIKLQPEVNLVK